MISCPKCGSDVELGAKKCSSCEYPWIPSVRSDSGVPQLSVEQSEEMTHDERMRHSRIVNVRQALNRGYDLFEYFGPEDDEILSLCSLLVGKVWALCELEKIEGEHVSGANVLIEGGGPGCRHHWQPVRKQWIGESERGDVDTLSEAGLLRSR